jgi:hypothetical protein
VLALPKHYWKALVDFYLYVNTPREPGDDSDGEGTVIDFDKMSPQRRMTMKEKWGQETVKGDPV